MQELCGKCKAPATRHKGRSHYCEMHWGEMQEARCYAEVWNDGWRSGRCDRAAIKGTRFCWQHTKKAQGV